MCTRCTALLGVAVMFLLSCSSGDDSSTDATAAPDASEVTVPEVTERAGVDSSADGDLIASPLDVQPDAAVVMQVAFGPDDEPWAVVDPSGDDHWAVVRREGDAWGTMASDGAAGPDFTQGQRNAPSLVGFGPDGGVWFTEMVGSPSGPYQLWELRAGEWTDHSEDGFGGYDHPAVAIDADGTVWTSLGDEVRRYDGDDWETDPDMAPDEFWARVGELGFPAAAPDVIDQLDVDADDADPACLAQLGVPALENPDALRPALRQAVLATAVGPDGEVWHSVICVGVVRFDPADRTTTVFPLDGVFENRLVTDVTVAPDGSLWVSGSGGIVRLVADSAD